MPELPEVEVLVRHLRPLLQDQVIRRVLVRRSKSVAPTTPRRMQQVLRGARFAGLSRRGKYLVFSMLPARGGEKFVMLGHLGMTGRMYLLPRGQPLPKHAAVALDLGRKVFVFEDTRYFGRLSLDAAAIGKLGPEPLQTEFTADRLGQALKRSAKAIKVKLLEQSLVAGVGNIYASEALFRAGIAPTLPARRLDREQVRRLWRAVRQVLREAIRWGSTVPLNYSGTDREDNLFYFGTAPDTVNFYEERLRVYDREGQPCAKCRKPIRRLVQGARSTFFCPNCQRR